MQGSGGISCLGDDDPPSAAPSGYTGSKLGERVGLNTFASDTGSLDWKVVHNDAPVVSPEDAQASKRLYKLAEIIGASKTPSSKVLWDFGPLVVDAAPCGARAMSESLLATLIQDDDTEFEEPAAPYDQDSLLERAITTGWKCHEEGQRDVDELVAAAVEAIEGDVTDHDNCVWT